jgi:Fic family protein
MNSYSPQSLPIHGLQWDDLIPRIGMAHAAIARYDGILQAMVNPSLLLSPLTTQEAVLSSRIEGTQATLEQVLEHDVAPGKETDREADIQEVVNYRTAMVSAVKWLRTEALDMELACKVHKVLLTGVRGHEKAPGKIRASQNYIGHRGASFKDALYVPPTPEDLKPALVNLNDFMQAPSKDLVVQTAIIHAQFELLHPFLDGNGRVGRILIPLLMYAKGLMASPTFYISEYMEEHRPAYYDGLAAISEKRDWQGWTAFFLQAVIEQATLSTQRAAAILDLYRRMKDEVNDVTRSQYAIQTLDALFDRPLLTVSDFVERTGIQRRTAERIVEDLLGSKILKIHEQGAGRRPSVLAFTRLIKLTEQRVF